MTQAITEKTFTTSSNYYNIKICSGNNCNTLYTTSTAGGVADVSGLVYTGAGSKELQYLLEKGTYSVSIQNIDSKFGVSAVASSPNFTVEGLDFAAGTELIDDFFNEEILTKILDNFPSNIKECIISQGC